jgi:hypothetical protein
MRIFIPVAFVVSGLMLGCTGDLVEIGPGARADMSGMAPADMAQAGGGEMGPSNLKFFPDIQMDIETKTCSLGACHGMNQAPIFKPMAQLATQADKDLNYNNFKSVVNLTAPDQSLVLTRPLPGSGHGGGTQFQNTQDPVYQRWLGWIQAGAPQQ